MGTSRWFSKARTGVEKWIGEKYVNKIGLQTGIVYKIRSTCAIGVLL
jgi:hypothetical protein